MMLYHWVGISDSSSMIFVYLAILPPIQPGGESTGLPGRLHNDSGQPGLMALYLEFI